MHVRKPWRETTSKQTWDETCWLLTLWCDQSKVCCVFVCSYLGKLVYLLDHSSKQSAHALVNQTLHVMNRLLIWQVQSKLVLHLEAKILNNIRHLLFHRATLYFGSSKWKWEDAMWMFVPINPVNHCHCYLMLTDFHLYRCLNLLSKCLDFVKVLLIKTWDAIIRYMFSYG